VIGGIDLGGTQVRLALAGPDGRIEKTLRASTPALGGPDGFIAWAVAGFDALSPGERPRLVGIGVPGPCDPVAGSLVNPPNLPGWPANLPLGPMLAAALGVPVKLENDANVAGLAEYRRGAGRGARSLAYVTWSTGIGAGLVLDGRLYSGAHGTAGEVGHMVLDPAGPICACGMRGCTEAYASGASLARQTGRSAAEVFAAAARGDAAMRAVVEAAASWVGLALLNLTNLVDPDVIVVGGGITNSWKLVSKGLRAPLRGSPFVTPARRPKVLRAALGTEVGLVGAIEWALANL